MINFGSYFKKVFSKLEISPNLEIRPYRDWKIGLSSFFVILGVVFWGHYLLYQNFVSRSDASKTNNAEQTSPNLEWENLKAVYGRFEQRTKTLNDLLAKPGSRIDPSR